MNQITVPDQIKQYKRELDAVVDQVQLPKNVTAKKITNAAVVAVTKNPDLLMADRASLHSSLRTCVSHGLIPDDVEATLQIYNTKVKDVWIKKVQYMPMIRGIIQRVENSGKVDRFWSEIVRSGEDFKIDISEGDRRPIHDIENYFARSKDIIGVYAVAKLSNGSIDCEAMSREQIDQVKNTAKTKNVWNTWYEEKAKVACMRRLAKRLPLSSDDLDMVMGDNEHDFDQSEEIKDITPDEKRPNLAQKLKEAETPEDAPIDGEVMPEIEYDENDVDPLSEAFKAGEEAFAAGVGDSQNPYPENPDTSSWMGGWLSMKEQSGGS